MAIADFYSLTEWYDILHAPGTARDVAVVRRIARRAKALGRDPGVWLEPACGTGRHLRVLAAKGDRALGFDLKPEMVAYAKRSFRDMRAPRPRAFVADMRDFDDGRRLPRIDVAFNLINTIRHLSSDAAMLAHFAAIARVLAPAGVYVVGVSLAAYGLEGPTEDVWTARRAGVRVSQVVQYEPPTGSRGEAARSERVISHLIVSRRGMPDEHVDSVYSLRSYNLAQWRELVRRSALREVAVADSSGAPATPSEPGYYLFVLARQD